MKDEFVKGLRLKNNITRDASDGKAYKSYSIASKHKSFHETLLHNKAETRTPPMIPNPFSYLSTALQPSVRPWQLFQFLHPIYETA
jgi:hypothetical protein